MKLYITHFFHVYLLDSNQSKLKINPSFKIFIFGTIIIKSKSKHIKITKTNHGNFANSNTTTHYFLSNTQPSVSKRRTALLQCYQA